MLNNEKIIEQNLSVAFQDTDTKSIIGGWLDCTDEENFEANIFLMEK